MAVTAWAAGQRITADKLNEMLPRWSSWTPTWSTTSGAAIPTIGNGTYDCEYTQTGDLVVARFEVVFGTTTNFGGGGANDNWTFSLPVTAASTQQVIGWTEINQSTTHRVVARARMFSTTTFMLEVSTGAPDGNALTSTGLVDALAPWNTAGVSDWASADFIRGTLTYKAA